MAQDLEQLVLSISADTAQMRRALKRLEGDVNQNTRNVERRFQRLGSAVELSFARIAGVFSGGFMIREFARLTDASIRIENAIRVTGASGAELDRVFDQLRDSANRNFAPLETLASLYSRMSLAQKQLGATSSEIMEVVDKVGLGLRIQGVSAQEARGALIQLTQAFGAGIVRAEEFNSIAEGAPILLRAVANGLKEASGDIAALRRLVIDGKVSSKDFFDAFQAGQWVLDQHADSLKGTVSQAYTQFENRMIAVAREMNKDVRAGENFTKVLDVLAGGIEVFAGDLVNLVDELEQVGKWLQWAGERATEFWDNLRQGTVGGLRGPSALVPLDEFDELTVGKVKAAQELGDKLREAAAQARGLAAVGNELGKDEFTARFFGAGAPVSLTPGATKPDATAKRAERERQRVLELIDALEEERRLIGATDAERAVSNALRQAGAAATDGQRQQIEALVRTIEKETDAFERLQEQMAEAQGMAKDFAGSLINDLLAGKSAADALANAFANLGQKLIDIALNQAITSLFSNLTGGLFGGGGLATGAPMNLLPGRASGGPVKAGQPYIVGEKRAELFVPNQNGTILPSVPEMPSAHGMARSGASQFTYAPTIDMRGASVEAVARLEQVLAKDRAEFGARVVQSVRQAQRTRAL